MMNAYQLHVQECMTRAARDALGGDVYVYDKGPDGPWVVELGHETTVTFASLSKLAENVGTDKIDLYTGEPGGPLSEVTWDDGVSPRLYIHKPVSPAAKFC